MFIAPGGVFASRMSPRVRLAPAPPPRGVRHHKHRPKWRRVIAPFMASVLRRRCAEASQIRSGGLRRHISGCRHFVIAALIYSHLPPAVHDHGPGHGLARRVMLSVRFRPLALSMGRRCGRPRAQPADGRRWLPVRSSAPGRAGRAPMAIFLRPTSPANELSIRMRRRPSRRQPLLTGVLPRYFRQQGRRRLMQRFALGTDPRRSRSHHEPAPRRPVRG